MYTKISPRRTRSARRFAVLLGTLAILGGCETSYEHPTVEPQPFVQDVVTLSHDVVFPLPGPNLDALQPSDLHRFVELSGAKPGDPMTLRAGGPYGRLRASVVRDLLVAWGYPLVDISDREGAVDRVTLSVERRIDMPETCVARNRYAPLTQSLLMSPGCANDLNLARMIENPEDLYKGRTPAPSRGADAAVRIESYQRGGSGGTSGGTSGTTSGGGAE